MDTAPAAGRDQLTVNLADCLLVQAEPRDLEVAVALADRDGGGLVMTGEHAVDACGLAWRRTSAGRCLLTVAGTPGT